MHGLFTHELTAAMREADASWSYADLMLQVGARVDARFAKGGESEAEMSAVSGHRV